MNKKPPPHDTDVKDMARRLKALWAPGQSVRPFLRQHAALFRELQSQGWSWAGLALALNKGKITYRTGKPWTADSLLQAFSRAQVPLRQRELIETGQSTEFDNIQPNMTNVQASAAMPELRLVRPSVPQPEPLNTATADLITTAGAKNASRFKPVSIKPAAPRPSLTETELAEIEQNRALTFGRS